MQVQKINSQMSMMNNRPSKVNNRPSFQGRVSDILKIILPKRELTEIQKAKKNEEWLEKGRAKIEKFLNKVVVKSKYKSLTGLDILKEHNVLRESYFSEFVKDPNYSEFGGNKTKKSSIFKIKRMLIEKIAGEKFLPEESKQVKKILNKFLSFDLLKIKEKTKSTPPRGYCYKSRLKLTSKGKKFLAEAGINVRKLKKEYLAEKKKLASESEIAMESYWNEFIESVKKAEIVEKESFYPGIETLSDIHAGFPKSEITENILKRAGYQNKRSK